MKFIFVLSACLLAAPLAQGKSAKMDFALKEFIVKTLHAGKPAPHLMCQVKIREIREQRTFSTGRQWVEMIELEFLNSGEYGRNVKTVFPLGSSVKVRRVNSEFGGLVEEVEMEAQDRLNKVFTFQHDGRGQIVWMAISDDLMNNPCRLK